jgi:tetratricopeptide (TPR) repeat protein
VKAKELSRHLPKIVSPPSPNTSCCPEQRPDRAKPFVVAALSAVLGLVLIVGLSWFATRREARVCYERGNAYFANLDYDNAIIAYSDAIKLDPKYAPAYLKRGLVWYYKPDHGVAINDYNDAIQLNPKDGEAYYNRGSAYKKLGKNAEAQADFEKAKQLGYIAWLKADSGSEKSGR